MKEYGKIFDYRNRTEAVIGKQYIFANYLKELIANPEGCIRAVLDDIQDAEEPFVNKNGYTYSYICEVAEKEVLMVRRQLAEWVAKGYGEYYSSNIGRVSTYYPYAFSQEDVLVDDDILIRPWGSKEWIKPTVDIYERDCK